MLKVNKDLKSSVAFVYFGSICPDVVSWSTGIVLKQNNFIPWDKMAGHHMMLLLLSSSVIITVIEILWIACAILFAWLYIEETVQIAWTNCHRGLYSIHIKRNSSTSITCLKPWAMIIAPLPLLDIKTRIIVVSITMSDAHFVIQWCQKWDGYQY